MIMPYVRTSAGHEGLRLRLQCRLLATPCSSQSWGKLTLMCPKVAIIESAFFDQAQAQGQQYTKTEEKQKSFARCLLILSKLFLYLI